MFWGEMLVKPNDCGESAAVVHDDDAKEDCDDNVACNG